MTVRVRYPEADPMGRLHHAVFLVYFEMGRTEYMRQRGVTYRDMEARKHFIPIIEVQCKYRAPAAYDDEVVIETWVKEVRGARVVFGNRAVRQDPTGETLLAEATIHGALIGADGQPKRFTPEDIAVMMGPPHQ
jgi:acyl-CoA thioester hydrolase